MAFLPAGVSTSLTLAAGMSVTLSGQGTAQFAPARGATQVHNVLASCSRLGPVDRTTVLNIAADPAGPGITFSGSSAGSGKTVPQALANNAAIAGNSFVAKGASPAPWAGAVNGWAPNTAYTVSTAIVPNYFNLSNGCAPIKWVCSTAGTSGDGGTPGGLEPDWPMNATPGTTVSDGTVVWTATDMAGAGNIPSWSMGFWHLAQMMSGQRLNELVVMGRSGRLAADILAYMHRVLAVPGLGTLFMSHTFENDVSAVTTASLFSIQSAWAAYVFWVDYARSLGLKVAVTTVAPSAFYDAAGAFTTYTNGAQTKAFVWLNKQIRAYAEARSDVVLVDPSQLWIDPAPANPVWPENATTYLVASGTTQQTKKTDDIHPQNAASFAYAYYLSPILAANWLPRTIFTTHNDAGANSINPLNNGTNGTATNISGSPAQAPTSKTCNATGGTAASCTVQPVARTDGVNGFWSTLAYAATAGGITNWSWTTAPNATFAGGTVVQGFSEIKVNANPTLLQYLVLVMRFPGQTNQFTQSHFASAADQDWGQFITADTVFTLKTLPWVSPAGTTTVNLLSEPAFRGAASGTVALGRDCIAPVSVPVAP